MKPMKLDNAASQYTPQQVDHATHAYKVACITRMAMHTAPDGTPTIEVLDASIREGVAAALEAVSPVGQPAARVDEVVDLIVRDVCEAPDINPDHSDAVCLSATNLRHIVDRRTAALAQNTQDYAEQIIEGKAQWDEVAKIIGADGDNVDDVFAKAKALAQNTPDGEAVDVALVAWNESAFTGSAGLRERLAEVVSAVIQAERSRVPAGYVLVPIKPTDKMRQAGFQAADSVSLGGNYPAAAWAAMLAAAPAQPAQGTSHE